MEVVAPKLVQEKLSMMQDSGGLAKTGKQNGNYHSISGSGFSVRGFSKYSYSLCEPGISLSSRGVESAV